METFNVNAVIKGPSVYRSSSQYKTKILLESISATSQISKPNTKYIIKYDFDLENQEIIFPKNCLIEFDGGSLNNGTIVGDNTIIISYLDPSKVLKNIRLRGTFQYSASTGPRLVILTEDEYNSLDNPDDNTIYFVTE